MAIRWLVGLLAETVATSLEMVLATEKVCWTVVTCRGRSKSKLKEQGVDYQIQRTLFFPTVHPAHKSSQSGTRFIHLIHSALVVLRGLVHTKQKLQEMSGCVALVQLCIIIIIKPGAELETFQVATT